MTSMSRISTVSRRELLSYLYSPMAYLTAFVFLVLTGVLFVQTSLNAGDESSLRPLFTAMTRVFVLCVPILTMRLMTDEYTSGTIETMMTAPLTDAELVWGKFLGVFLFYCGLLGLTLIHVAVVAYAGAIDWGVLILSYLGMVLLGALFTSVGLFASACTRYQLVAALTGAGVLALLTFVADFLSQQFPNQRDILAKLNVQGQFDLFGRGIFDTSAVIYFLSCTLFFVFLSIKVVESRRWR